MNPYYPYYHNVNILQRQPYFYYYTIPVDHTNGVVYPQSMQYIEDVAILSNNNISNTVQQNQYVPYPTPEDTLIFNPSFVHPYLSFLEDSLIMQELEAELEAELEQLSITRNGSGISKEKISKHLRVQGNVTTGDEGDICCICLDEYGENRKIGILECGHRFHEECIKRWLSSKNVCPMCRSTALTI